MPTGRSPRRSTAGCRTSTSSPPRRNRSRRSSSPGTLPHMEASSAVSIRHPNREKAESKATKAIVVLLLLASAGLILLVTAGGWTDLQGAQFVAIATILIYLVMAYYVARWNRGV